MEDPLHARLSLTDPAPEGRTRLGLLRALRVEDLTVAELADRVGLHENSVRFHLRRLQADGLVESVEPDTPAGRGRPSQRFRATVRASAHGTRSHGVLAAVLVKHLATGPEPRAQALAAGREWATTLDVRAVAGPTDQLATLLAALEDLGFEPGAPVDGAVGLHHCPFLTFVDSGSPVVCALHQGILESIAERAGGAVRLGDLEPFAEPGVCRLPYERR